MISKDYEIVHELFTTIKEYVNNNQNDFVFIHQNFNIE